MNGVDVSALDVDVFALENLGFNFATKFRSHRNRFKWDLEDARGLVINDIKRAYRQERQEHGWSLYTRKGHTIGLEVYELPMTITKVKKTIQELEDFISSRSKRRRISRLTADQNRELYGLIVRNAFDWNSEEFNCWGDRVSGNPIIDLKKGLRSIK